MIHQQKKALLVPAADIFKRGGQVASAAGIADETPRDPDAETGDMSGDRLAICIAQRVRA
jgi:hypothetical protein